MLPGPLAVERATLGETPVLILHCSNWVRFAKSACKDWSATIVSRSFSTCFTFSS